MEKNFYDVVKGRRSYYGIGKEVVVSHDKIQEVVEHAVKYVPSAFNSQTTRVLVLLDNAHDDLWNLTMEALRKVVPADQFSSTEDKINSFKAGYGTLLFFEDNSIVESLQQQFALYKDNFPVWSQQTSGMHQFAIWSALEAEGLGASLQHYNELIEQDVKSKWSVPNSWKLIAQMPFGNPTTEPGEKEYKPLEDRVKIYK